MKKVIASVMTVAMALSLTVGVAMAQKPAGDALGGLDLNSYCSHTGRGNDSHVKSGTQDWYCTATNNDASNHVKIGEACEWQYAGNRHFAATSKEAVPGDPLTYTCYF